MAGKVRFGITTSVDGFLAGPGQSVENPLGIGGMRLHDWAVELAVWRAQHGLEGGEVNASTRVVDESTANVGAYVMGRNMFGGGKGPWDEAWKGWWGDDPPFHAPVFVVTHHVRERLPLEGGTTFFFVTDGVERAIEQATEAAEGKDVVIAGGAAVVQQALRAGVVDEFTVSAAPILLGSGTRLLDNLADADIELERIEVVEAPKVTHVKYRVRAAN